MATDPNTGLNIAAPSAPVLNVPGGPTPPPAPLPTGVILGAGAPPVQPTQQTAQPTTTQNQTQQPTQQAPTNPVKDKLAAVGHAVTHFAHALEGKQVVYNTDPTTGDVTSQVVSRKPGGFFRDILLGAISGAAAASEPTTHPSGAAGFARGALAAQQSLQQQQQLRKTAAQEKGTEIAQMNARQLAAATAAHDTVSSFDIGHNLNFHNPDELNKYNSSVNTVKDQALKAGGQVVSLQGGLKNGEAGNGPALLAAYNQDPSIMQGPEGFHRVAFITHDPGELEHDGANWKGKADWNGHATVTLVDIPNDVFGKQISLTKAQANSAAGREIAKGKGDEPVQTTFGSLFALGLKNKQDIIAARNERNRGPKDENEATSWVSQVAGMDPKDPDYALAQARAQKGQAFLDAKAGEKSEKAPLIDSVPKAQAAVDSATIALRANPNDSTLKQNLQDAKDRRDNLVEIENKQKRIQAGQDAAAKAQAEGKDIEAMYKTGVNPISKERLSLANAPDEFLIDQRTGNPIPTGMLATVKPTMQEINRHDFSGSVLHSLDQIDKLREQGKLPNGPLSGMTQQKLAKMGLSTEDAQEAMNFISFAQSAATGAHVGGRFSVPVMEKMNSMIGLRMNSGEFKGAEESIRDVMQQYRDNGGRMTVAEYKALTPEQRAALRVGGGAATPTAGGPTQPNLPALQPGFVRFRDSRGGVHDIPQGNLAAARQRDKGLTVLQGQ